MNKQEVIEAATKLGFDSVHFQFNLSRNTGEEFEVGYVTDNNKQSLFCKRQPKSTEDDFYLCNDYLIVLACK